MRTGSVTNSAARLAALALVVGVTALAGPRVSEAQTAPERAAFKHERHRSVACGVCHAVDQRHRTRRSWTTVDCAACHHGGATPAGCTSCHERADFAAPRDVATPMHLSVWQAPRVRNLSFDHDRHGEVGCLECHQGGMSLPPASCSTCHTHHHRPQAECAQCHVAPAAPVHDLASHASCGACHSAEATARPMLSRSSCLVCHTEQREHRPDRSCAKCHIMPTTTNRE